MRRRAFLPSRVLREKPPCELAGLPCQEAGCYLWQPTHGGGTCTWKPAAERQAVAK